MNLELAHRLNLVQRQIEHAQLMLDSAVEMMNVVMAEAQVTAPAVQAEVDDAMPVTRRKAATAASTKTQAAKPMTGTGVVREFLKSHSGDFKVPDVLAWAKSKGIAANKKRVKSAAYSLANIGKEVISTGKGSGIYRKAA